MTRRRAVLGAIALLDVVLGACGRSPASPHVSSRSTAPRPPATSLLRFARDGGPVRLYRAADLDEGGWRSADKLPAARRVVGADLDQRLVYAVDTKGTLAALDLDTRRIRPLFKGVERAALGPDGALYAVDTAGQVTQLAHRVPLHFRNALAAAPRALFATLGGSLVALPDRGQAVQVLTAQQSNGDVRLPVGPAAATAYGDVVAVAADSVVALFEPGAKGGPRQIRVPGHARAALFSPSGHRLYVAQDDDALLVLDRFRGDRLDQIKLPGPASGIRSDLYGAWLLVRSRQGDTTWVVDAAGGRYVGAVATHWGADLPAVAAPATLVVRRGPAVVGLDLAQKGFPEVGRVEGAAEDLWLPLGWSPQAAEPPASADSGAAVRDSTHIDSAAAHGSRIYLQVSSSRNPTWAAELADKIKAAGLPASVLPPARGEELHRVVLGPFATREEAEQAGRKVGMPSFIITADSDR